MDTTSSQLAVRYLAALRAHLEQGPEAGPTPARALGRQALRLGLGAVNLVQIHEQALVALVFPEYLLERGDGMIERSGVFLRQALAPVLAATLSSRQTNGHAAAPDAATVPRPAERVAARQRLKHEIERRRAAELALKKSQLHGRQVLAQSRLMQAQLRHLSHQILCVQEEERRRISRELHDEISQTLTGINVRLAALRIEATANTGGLKRRIASTQRLVEKSVAAVHQFARQLRPAMLDDLGLVPTLLSYVRDVGKRTGLRIHLRTAAANRIETLSGFKRTVLYRIAQEALTNVVRHAEASEVKMTVQAEPDTVLLEVTDNGRSFDVARVLGARRYRRLGVLGMRERAEMAGGSFVIESAPGKGTTVRVRVPMQSGARE